MPAITNVRCPYCQEEISLETKRCFYCGENLVIDLYSIEVELKKIFIERKEQVSEYDSSIAADSSETNYIKKVKDYPNKNKSNFILKILALTIIASFFFFIYSNIYKVKYINSKINEIKKMIAYENYSRALFITNELLSKYPNNKAGKELKKTIRGNYIKLGKKSLFKRDYTLAIYYYYKAQQIRYSVKVAQYIQQVTKKQKIKKIDDRWRKNGIYQKYISLFSNGIKLRVDNDGYLAKKILMYSNFSTHRKIPKSENTIFSNYGSYLFIMDLERLQGRDFYIDGDRLIIEMKEKNHSYWPSKYLYHRNFIVRFKLEYISGKSTSGAGFWFRSPYNLSKRYYAIFDLSGLNYQYNVGYYDKYKGKWIDLKEWTNIYINKPRIIELAVIEHYLQIYINGKYINTISGIQNKTGTQLGFVAGSDHVKYAIDDFCLLSLKRKD